MSFKIGFWRPKKNVSYAYFEVLGVSSAHEGVGFFHQDNGTTQASWLKGDAYMEHEYVGPEKPKTQVKKTRQAWLLPDGSLSDTEVLGATPATLTWLVQG